MAEIKSEKEQLSDLENLFQQKRFSDALEVAKKASTDYPNSYPIKFLYVRTLKELNKLADAEEVLKELMMMYPNNINLLLECGDLAVLRNKFDEGNEYYNKILFLDPFNTEAKNSIEKINIIKKGGLVEKGKGDFVSYQDKKLQSADTLPEFDSGKLRDIMSEEPPPPPPPAPEMKAEPVKEQEPELPSFSPPPVSEMSEESIKEEEPELPSFSPPPVPEMIEEVPEMGEVPEMSEISDEDTDETEAANLFQRKIQEQEKGETEIQPPLSNMEEMNSSPGLVAEEPGTLSIPEYEIQPVKNIEKELEEIGKYAQKEHREPQAREMEEPGESWQDEPGNEEKGIEEPGFVTESAAELYVEQGLLKDAVAIYEKLYDSRKEERFLSKIEELKQIIVNQKKIQVLNELLKHIKQKGEAIV